MMFTQRSPGVSNNSSHSPLPVEPVLAKIKKSLREQISLIGQTDPTLAAELSGRVVCCHWSKRELDVLRSRGLLIEPFALVLRGGGLEDVAADVLKATLVQGITLLVEGNQKEMEEKRTVDLVKACVVLPDGSKEQGTHSGTRLVEHKTNRFLCCLPLYALEASGRGKFQSLRVTYEGDFYNNLFHDNTGTAKFFVNQDVRYTGCFKMGKRHGHGKLEQYSDRTGGFCVRFEGMWNEDRPQRGDAYTTKGEKVPYADFPYVLNQHASCTTPLLKGTLDAAMSAASASPSPRRSGIQAHSAAPVPAPAGKPPSQAPAPQAALTAAQLPASPLTPLQYPTPEENPLIQTKLRNPQKPLSVEESIALLTQCVRYGEIQAHKAADKEILIFIGNTGAGKSTTANYLAGCTLVKKSPKELGLKGLQNVVTVVPPSAGGSLAEIMPIGHTRESKTFMPQIETPGSSGLTYCDCPGFLDNRGAEINIANAVNIRAALSKAHGVKVLVLINYHSLLADRGRGLSEMLRICSNLFGSVEHLTGHKESLLIGVTNTPSDLDIDTLKEWIAGDNLPLMMALAERIFTFDPTEPTAAHGRWNRQECLDQIARLTPIQNPKVIFRTVLTDEDETTLLRISEAIEQKIEETIQTQNYKQAALHLHHLEELSVIDHVAVERLLGTSRRHIERKLQELISQFTNYCNFEKFEQAQELLDRLPQAYAYFPFLRFPSQQLRDYYQAAQDKSAQAQAKEQALLSQISEVSALLEQQKQVMENKLVEQGRKYDRLIQEQREQSTRTERDYKDRLRQLELEIGKRLEKKNAELSAIQGQNAQELSESMAREKAKLETEYASKLKQVETELRKQLQKQLAEQQRVQTEKAKEQEKIRHELAKIAAQQAGQKAAAAAQQQAAVVRSSPARAFGAVEWNTYFGDVGVEPPLPADINNILEGPCPIWAGRKVKDTHMLVLIPQTVNGRPLSLNALDELVRVPRNGGNPTQLDVSASWERALAEHGPIPAPASHWVLMTRQAVPNSTSKSYSNQRALVAGLGSSYEVPHLLDAVTCVLLERIRTGAFLYGKGPWVRVQEQVEDDRLVFGAFAASGLRVYGSFDGDDNGVAALRKF